MAAYRRVYDSRHLQEPYAWQSSMGYLYLFYTDHEDTSRRRPAEFSSRLVPHGVNVALAYTCLLLYLLDRRPSLIRVNSYLCSL